MIIVKILICLVLWLIAVAFTACGASFGNSSIGTTGYLKAHNEKLEILYGDSPMDYHSISDKRKLGAVISRGVK